MLFSNSFNFPFQVNHLIVFVLIITNYILFYSIHVVQHIIWIKNKHIRARNMNCSVQCTTYIFLYHWYNIKNSSTDVHHMIYISGSSYPTIILFHNVRNVNCYACVAHIKIDIAAMPSIYQAMMAKQSEKMSCAYVATAYATKSWNKNPIFFFITNCQLLATLEQCDLYSHSHCKKWFDKRIHTMATLHFICSHHAFNVGISTISIVVFSKTTTTENIDWFFWIESNNFCETQFSYCMHLVCLKLG